MATFLARRDAVFTIEDHAVRNIDHQHGGSLCLEIRFADSEVIFLHIERLDAVIDLGIADARGEIDLLQHITKLEWTCFRILFITLTWV